MENNFFKIGEAVRILKKEYENLTASMLRYWDQKGVVEASEKTEGRQRVYTAGDLNLIRYARELSIFGCTLSVVRKAIKETKLVAKTPGYSAESFRKALIKLIRDLRAFNDLKRRLKIHNQQSPEERSKPIYDRETLVRLLGDDLVIEKIIDEAEAHDLTSYRELGEEKKYSRADEMVLRCLLSLTGLLGVNKLKNLCGDIKELENTESIFITTEAKRNLTYFLLPGVHPWFLEEHRITSQDRLLRLVAQSL